MPRLRSGISSPSSYSFWCTLRAPPCKLKPSTTVSKYCSSLAEALFPSNLISIYCFGPTLSFKPRAAALLLLGFGVVATKWALSKIIISLNYAKSLKLNNKSMIYSSISSLRLYSSFEKYSSSKTGQSSLSLFIKYASIVV